MCKCGCGTPTSFITITKGYNLYIKGHNPAHSFSDEERALSKQKHKENVANGIFVKKERATVIFDPTKEHQCPDCQASYDSLLSLSLHYRGTHKKSARELVLNTKLGGVVPMCECGCGQPVKFLDISRGFSRFKQGHSSRVPGRNNWINNTGAKDKSLGVRKQMIADGVYKPFVEKTTGQHWALGRTAETDERLARKTEALRNNLTELETRSTRMKENRFNGVIPTLTGPNHSQWKGGTSPLYNVCHGNYRLFKEWKYPKLLEANFACQTCKQQNKKGTPVSLHVHHDKIRMATIVKLIAEEHSWETFYAKSLEPENKEIFDLKQKISDAVVDFHIKNNVSGVVLCEKCHNELHSKMNFKKSG